MAEVHRLAEEEKEAQTGGWSDLAVAVDPPPAAHRHRAGRVPAVHRNQLDHVLRHPAAGGCRLLQPRRRIIANTANGLFSVLGITVGLSLMNKVNRRTMLLVGFGLTTFSTSWSACRRF